MRYSLFGQKDCTPAMDGQPNQTAPRPSTTVGIVICLVAISATSIGCQSGKSWAPKFPEMKLPQLKMPKLAWGSGLKFGQDKPNKDDLLPPSLQFDPAGTDSADERLAENVGYGRDRSDSRAHYGNEPINRDPNLERAPYSRSGRPGSDLAGNRPNNSFGGSSSQAGGFPSGNSFDNSSTLASNSNGFGGGSNQFGGGSSLPNANLLPSGGDPSTHQPAVRNIPGGPLPGANNMHGGMGNSLATNANELPPMAGFENNSSNVGSQNPLQPAPGGFGGNNGNDLASSLPSPPNMTASNNGFQNNSLPNGGFPTQPASGAGNNHGMVQPAAPTMADTSNMLKPYRPGSTANPTSAAASTSALPSYPSTRYGNFQSPANRTARKPATNQFGAIGGANGQGSLPPTSKSGTLTKHPNGVICDGDKCYLPQN